MVKWISHVAIAAPRNGTTTHTVDPSSGTVVAGALFTPTAGRLLVVLAEGAVTSTTPSGWTLPSGGSAINSTGLYVWHRTAAGGDTFTTTHNGSNYPLVFDVYEFPAGSTLLAAAQAVTVATGGTGPSLSGLSASANLRIAAAAKAVSNSTPLSFTWASATEVVDTSVTASGTDGYAYSLAYVEDATGATFSAAVEDSGGSGTQERLVFALDVAESSNTVTGSLSATTPAVTIAAPTASITGTTTVPTYAGTLTADAPAVIIGAPTLTATGAATVPTYTGSLDAETPGISLDVPTAEITGTYRPTGAATLDAQTPGITIGVPAATITGTFTIPDRTGELAATMPTVTVHAPTASISGVATVPTYTGTLTAALPGLTVAVPHAAITGRNPDHAPPDDLTLRLVAEHTSIITLVEHTSTITIRERG